MQWSSSTAWRGVGGKEDLGTCHGGCPWRAIEPEVLADHHTKSDALDLENQRVLADFQIASLVENPIIGEFVLEVLTQYTGLEQD